MDRRLDSIEALMKGVIDYAGLFPPAALPMQQAVDNYALYAGESHGWMLGRFVVPAQRLTEFEKALPAGARNWHVSALGGNDLLNDLAAIEAFNASNSGAVLIDTFETKVSDASQLAPLRTLDLEVYCEIAISGELISSIAAAGLKAKVRTGGVVSDMIPTPEAVAGFIYECAQKKVPLKATAGLHHPLRCERDLTYDQGSPRATMHGFLNFFCAASAAWHGASVDELEQMMEAETVEALLTLTPEQYTEARSRFAGSFGSCSFKEPVHELSAMGLI